MESSIGTTLAKEKDVSKWPTLMVETAEGEQHIYDGKMKLPELVEFVKPFALEE